MITIIILDCWATNYQTNGLSYYWAKK